MLMSELLRRKGSASLGVLRETVCPRIPPDFCMQSGEHTLHPGNAFGRKKREAAGVSGNCCRCPPGVLVSMAAYNVFLVLIFEVY